MDEAGLYNIAPGETPQAVSSRRKIAEALMSQGMQTTPIQHWTQGAARLAQALVGGMGMSRADEQDASGIANAMRAYSAGMSDNAGPGPAGAPQAPPGMPATPPRPPGAVPNGGGGLPPNVPTSEISLGDMRPPQSDIRAAFANPYARSQMPPAAAAKPGFLPPGGSAQPDASPVATALAGSPRMGSSAAPPMQAPGAPQAPQQPGNRINPALIASLANPYLPKPMQELAMHKVKEQMKSPEFTHFTAGDKNMVFSKSDPGDVRNLGASSENKFGNVAELRKEIHTLPSYKNWTQAEPIYRSMLETQGTDSKASDLNLVYGLGKIMDPTSVVREGEMIMVSKTASLPDWLIGSINGLNGGAKLTPDTRKAILAEAKVRAGQYYDMVQQDVAPYRGIAQRFNMHPDDIIPPIRPLASPPAPMAAPGMQTAGAPAARQAPSGVDPKIWAVMTPQERALWK